MEIEDAQLGQLAGRRLGSIIAGLPENALGIYHTLMDRRPFSLSTNLVLRQGRFAL